MAARGAIGTPTECVEKLQAYVNAGCRKYVLDHPSAPPDELDTQIELYGRPMVPPFS